MSNLVRKGVYRKYTGDYIIVLDLVIEDDMLVSNGPVALVSDLISYGTSIKRTIPVSEFFDNVSDDEINVTGQTFKYQRVDSFDTASLRNFDTQSLIKELADRDDSPLQKLGIEGLSNKVFATDYVYGVPYEETEETPKGVDTLAVFDTEGEAKKYLLNHSTGRGIVFKRTFIVL